MTDIQAKKVEDLLERLATHHPELKGHEGKVRHAMTFIVDKLATQDPDAPGAFMPEQYFEAVEKSLPRKEEEPSDESRGSSLP